MRPAISVLIPYYNKAEFIRDTVLSAVGQTLSGWELVIVDDGSTDTSEQVLDGLLLEYPNRLILVYRRPHVGCAGATDFAVRVASAPLCTILDGDDLLEPHSLQTVVDFFNANPAVVYAWTKYRCKSPSATSWKGGRSKALPDGKTLKSALLSGWWGALAQRSFRKAAYLETGGLDHRLAYAVDQQLAMLFARLGKPVAHIPVVTYRHIQHGKQMSATHYKEQQHCRGEILKRLGGGYVRER